MLTMVQHALLPKEDVQPFISESLSKLAARLIYQLE